MSESMSCCVKEYTAQHGLEVPIEVETRTLQEVLEVKELIQEHSHLRINRVMLDNMTALDNSREGGHSAPGCCSMQCASTLQLQSAAQGQGE